MTHQEPATPNSTDRLARAAESFDNQLRKRGEAVWPSTVGGDRIPSLLELIHATLRPGSTRSIDSNDSAVLSFVVPPQVGRFKVGPEVGRGGFGVVYRAYDELLHREVALKAVPRRAGHSSMSDEIRLREARAVARLNHPNLVPLYEVLDDENCVYLISEFCNGPTLSQYLEEAAGPLTPKAAAQITLQVAQAIAHAHDRGLVHRDIKPGNILLVTECVDGDTLPFTPRLTDFGLVLETSDSTQIPFSARLAGTVNYMSPEQILCEDRWDARLSDVYSLGLLLYRMLSGRLPYHVTTPLELLEEICSQPFVKLPDLTPPLSADLVAVCHKAIEKEPSARYESARELANDLSRWLDGRPVSARKQSAGERIILAIRREPVVASLVTAFVFLAIVSSITFAWSNRLLRLQGAELKQAVQVASVNESKAIQAAYFADITQAYSAVARNDAATALSILGQIDDYIAAEHRDRFDLKLLRSLAQQGWFEAAQHEGPIEEIVVVPSLNAFAVASESSGVSLVRQTDGKTIDIYQAKGNEKIKALAVSPDGSSMAIGRSTERTIVWGFSSATQTVDVLPLDEFKENSNKSSLISNIDEVSIRNLGVFDTTVESLVFSADGRWLAVGTRYEPITVFDLQTNDLPLTLANERRNEDLSFSTNQDLAWISTKTSISVKDVLEEKEPRTIDIPSPHELRRVRQSSDGKWIVAALFHTGDAFLYHTTLRDDEPIMLQHSGGEVRSICFSPNGDSLAIGLVNGSVVLWDLEQLELHLTERDQDSEQSKSEPLRVSTGKIHCIHDSPVTAIAINDEKTILSGDTDGMIAISGGPSIHPIDQEIDLPTKTRAACVSKDGNWTFVGGEDGSVWSIDTQSNQPKMLHELCQTPVTRIALSHDDQLLAVGFLDGRAMIRKVNEIGDWYEIPFENPLDGSAMLVSGIEFDPVLNALTIVRGKSILQRLEVQFAQTGDSRLSCAQQYFFHAPTSIHTCAVRADASIFTYSDKYYHCPLDQNVLPQALAGDYGIRVGCFDLSTEMMFLGTDDGHIRVVDAAGLTVLVSQRWNPLEVDVEGAREITAIALSPNGENVLTGSNLGDIGIWDRKTLRYLGTIIPANGQGSIQTIRVVRNGTMLVSHQYNETANHDEQPGEIHVVSIK